MYSVAKFAIIYAILAFNLEDVISLAIDITMRCNVGISGEHVPNAVILKRNTN